MSHAPFAEFFGRYRLLEEVGHGGAAVVHLAFDPAIGRRVALKVLDTGVRRRHGAWQRALREARAVGAMSHANIVALHDVFEHRRRIGLVMEFVDGESLQVRLERSGRLPVAEALSIAVKVATALAHAHAQGVVHGDIKPGNILIGTDGSVKLADFGLARMRALSIPPHAPVEGTPPYMAPELFLEETPGTRSDVYSVGAVLFEMVAGRPAHAGDSIEEISRSVRFLVPALPEGISAAMNALLARLLAKDPVMRPADGHALLRALDVPELEITRPRSAAAVKSAPTEVVPPPRAPNRKDSGITSWLSVLAAGKSRDRPTTGPGRWQVRHGAVVAIIAMLCLGVAAMYGIFLGRQAPPPVDATVSSPAAPNAAKPQARTDASPLSQTELRRLATIQSRIDELDRRIERMRQQYTEAYPDVVAARRQIRRLEAERHALLGRAETQSAVD